MTTHSRRNEPLPGVFQTCVISTHIESIEQSARLQSLTRWAVGPAPELWARPVWPAPLLLVTRPCPLDPTQRLVGHWRMYADIRAHQGHNLDYLQGQGRLMRPPRDGSLRIHPSLGTSVGARGTI